MIIIFCAAVIKTSPENRKGLNSEFQNVTNIPFELEGKLIIVKVLLNGEEQDFILDSGAPRVILNSHYMTEKDTIMRIISGAKGVGGTISGMSMRTIKELDFYGIKLIDKEVLALNITHLEKEFGTKIHGLIGFDLIKDYDVLFDYKAKKITLIKPSFFDEYLRKNFSKKNLQKNPFRLEGHIPVIEAKIGIDTLVFGIDCGAESNLIDDDLYSQLKKYTRRKKKDKVIGADNKLNIVKKGKVKETLIGKKTFKKLDTYYIDLSHLNEGYGLNIDGLIGYEVLSKQISVISFKRRELVFIE